MGSSMRVLGLRPVWLVVVVGCLLLGTLGTGAIPAGAVSLPDGRVYELVSPNVRGREAGVYVPEAGLFYLGVFGEHGVGTENPLQVSSSGESVAYDGEPTAAGGDGKYGGGRANEFLATRSPEGGWVSQDLQLPGANVEYLAFSSDLSQALVEESVKPLTSGSPGELYLHATGGGSNGEYNPLYTGAPRELRSIQFGGYRQPLANGYAGNSGTSAVPAYTDLLFEANAALKSTPEAVEGGELQNNLYDSVNGGLYLVNVLPNGNTEPNATFGTLAESPENRPGFSHVISADGSRVFWTDLNNGNIYVRENPASGAATTKLVGNGVYRTASTDGSKVFFTNGDLYEYNVNSGQTTDLTPGAAVQGVLAASDDGSYVYFASGAKLASGATEGDCQYHNGNTSQEEEEDNRGEIPPGKACNLYLFHDGALVRFIATLSPVDEMGVMPFGRGGGNGQHGDWQTSPGYNTSQVTPDGHSLIFESNQSLTGYDPKHATYGIVLDELFLYDAVTGKRRCISCNPTGEAPTRTHFGGEFPFGGFFPVTNKQGEPIRVMSADGSRVFFDSAEPLVPQDVNGLLDVYEWERDGSGSCKEVEGCIYLLSGGADPESSYLMGVSASGNDAFLISRAELIAQDEGNDDLVYDARVGGVQPPSLPACSGSGCQGVPPAPPIFATPSSVTFNGVGNFPPPPVGQAKPKTGIPTSAQKLAAALRACRAKRNVHKRKVCEASARRRYRAKSKATKSNRGSK
jgi:hypothetical protein